LLLVHALPNGIAPIVQVIALAFFTSRRIVLVEYVFRFPALARTS